MITIIKYHSTGSEELGKIFKELGCDYEYSNQEKCLCQSDLIILPDCVNIAASLRKLRLYNITNLLKVVKRPLLAINMGLNLLCDNIGETKGIGLLPLNSRPADELGEFKKGQFYSVNVRDSARIFHDKSETGFYFMNSFYIPENQLSTSDIQIDGRKITATIEYGKVSGVQFNPEKSGEKGVEFLKNFISGII